MIELKLQCVHPENDGTKEVLVKMELIDDDDSLVFQCPQCKKEIVFSIKEVEKT